ncbi:hypothetical protein [Celeribacter sp. PS-C1]|uniref:hypothetical protein n=1 Tax=Celeribacter sp. PS-C1 TaxID=2820813 RepID=UPI001CA542C7|nr:hypothetical protein [Celeribacter sp. PS-C1]MBW6416112.1 hypothetical protein [Celeribacter sp. PS-C1]
MFGKTAQSTPPSAVFLILCDEWNLGESLRLALLSVTPEALILWATTPGEALVEITKQSEVTAAFLALPASEVNAGSLGHRLEQRGARIVIWGASPSQAAPPFETLSWPQDIRALKLFLEKPAKDQS